MNLTPAKAKIIQELLPELPYVPNKGYIEAYHHEILISWEDFRGAKQYRRITEDGKLFSRQVCQPLSSGGGVTIFSWGSGGTAFLPDFCVNQFEWEKEYRSLDPAHVLILGAALGEPATRQFARVHRSEIAALRIALLREDKAAPTSSAP